MLSSCWYWSPVDLWRNQRVGTGHVGAGRACLRVCTLRNENDTHGSADRRRPQPPRTVHDVILSACFATEDEQSAPYACHCCCMCVCECVCGRACTAHACKCRNLSFWTGIPIFTQLDETVAPLEATKSSAFQVTAVTLCLDRKLRISPFPVCSTYVQSREISWIFVGVNAKCCLFYQILTTRGM